MRLIPFALMFSLASAIPGYTVSTLEARALNPQCAPGGNFDFSSWELQLPIGNPGSPTTISSSALEGCSGYQDPGHDYFFTESGDGALVLKVPGAPSSSGCVTTPNTKFCRTELREQSPSSWDPRAAKNRLSATVSVPKPDNSNHGTVVGQIHMDASVSSFPVAKLYYKSNGDISIGVHKSQSGGTEYYTSIGNIPVGKTFSYEIRYENSTLSLSINGGALKEVSLGNLNSPSSYFKAGNYNQGDTPSEVHFFDISVQH
ncbi:uncharacterized protein N7458_001064 [Penicillium daleae]|uniref:Alginate lyase 2 domain-containing protein n=1 Tax=Penicillium daleae TaxID=63821 RepID=A0AAD6CCK2_9EURO|nr:uncharacterized protein N7458_001064 [Penicillium daleae]KAJ5459512.1 hypothetical protein N7458_001064 [Penicillium daleae]